MSLDKLRSLYKAVILDHAQMPRNYGQLTDFSYETTVYNPSCGDKIHLTILIENNKIKKIAFNGEGCTISKASASMMTDLVKGKSIKEAIELSQLFSNLAVGKNSDTLKLEQLGDAQVLVNIMQFPARIKCATLTWWGLDRALLGKEKEEEND